jgi:hypothetical protein
VKQKITILFFLSAILLFSQQNFINVPSSELTKKHKLFFQQQINFNELIQSNTTLDFGLGKGFEIGVNVLGVNFSENRVSIIKNDTNDRDPFNPLITLNGLKRIDIDEKVSISFGTQFGFNYSLNKNRRKALLGYGNLSFKDVLFKDCNLVLGTYYNSMHYGGNGNRLGVWGAAEIPIVHKLHFLAETILGNNAISYTSLGFVYYPIKRMPLTFGVQIPNTKRNAYSLVFELTIVP